MKFCYGAIVLTAFISDIQAARRPGQGRMQVVKPPLRPITRRDNLKRALLKDQMGLLDGYGCWCYFETDHGAGKGKPIDPVDEMCKTLHDGYTCILMDAADRGITCIPWEVPYTSAFGGGVPSGMDIATLQSECDANNGGSLTCESWACKVEGWFVQSYFQYGLSGGAIDTTKEHVNGFNTDLECITTPGVKSVDKECCNDFPKRFPYKTYSGLKACCNDHTYDPTVKLCCPDGKSKVVC